MLPGKKRETIKCFEHTGKSSCLTFQQQLNKCKFEIKPTIQKEGIFFSFPLTAIANFACPGAVYCIKAKPASAILISMWDIRGTTYNTKLVCAENTDLAFLTLDLLTGAFGT